MARIAIMVGTFFTPAVAVAHPEHGSGGNFGALHYLADPFHAGLTALALVGFVAARRAMLRRRSLERPGQ